MTAQNIQADKAILINWINELKDASIIKEMKKFYTKSEEFSKDDKLIISEFSEAIEEMNLINAGKKEARDLDDFLNEL